ncbi:hypothetical protein D9756_011303 [Leucocoprinus leucothites]|uniref:GH16 domain-containing protein n=1 Tax=Leucocoprinus leucothites TaxID=201217 RepID=A0A8H5FQ40_9AGAR|nr:hypothetical protein D9756_011303 [Leucoagaricus leucothites]
MKPAFALLLSSILVPIYAATYSISDTVVPSSFLNFFEFQAIADPTMDDNYVDQSTAVSQGLVNQASSTSFIVRADDRTVLNPNGAGRNSVRIRSKKTYTTHVAVFDVHHMPQGCGTWPAIWETNEAQWPNGGEIDIVEGVNDQALMPLHYIRALNSTQLDCNAAVNGNSGCGVRFPTANSYGPSFNSNGGGWYAVERSSSAIRHFSNHNIIINLTFCGDWAGAVYGQSGCPSTCVDFVNNNPSAFSGAYFDFASIRVYQ